MIVWPTWGFIPCQDQYERFTYKRSPMGYCVNIWTLIHSIFDVFSYRLKPFFYYKDFQSSFFPISSYPSKTDSSGTKMRLISIGYLNLFDSFKYLISLLSSSWISSNQTQFSNAIYRRTELWPSGQIIHIQSTCF